MKCPICGDEMERLPEHTLYTPYVCQRDGILVIEFKVKKDFTQGVQRQRGGKFE